jgi:hypothetical protein
MLPVCRLSRLTLVATLLAGILRISMTLNGNERLKSRRSTPVHTVIHLRRANRLECSGHPFALRFLAEQHIMGP